ncbi:MAG: SUMF1/EgtB/PvdO family nonheme iron enzyme [Spirochaetaceae bacterium]|jgi:formylglycine-generating enzyme required for sulfatase activity|nr:SUMF1/EgtB/PvdO family nonheme iron enzyme [Spirochaetaceae bacterium]
MSMKKLCLLVLVCLLGLPTAFALGKKDAEAPKVSSGMNIQGGNAGTPRKYTTGAVLDEESYNKLPLQGSVTGPLSSARGEGTRGAAQIPSAYSLKKYAPIPGDQGEIGSCTAWAAAYGAKTIMESIRLERTNRYLTTRNVYSPLYCYEVAMEIDEKPEAAGANITTVVSMMRNFGVPKESDYRKLSTTAANRATRLNPDADNLRKWKITGSDALFQMDYEKAIVGDYSPTAMNFRINMIKNNISQGNPVIVGIIPSNSFMELTGEQWKPKANERPNPENGHAVCVIGYDDNKFGGAFEILNSWTEYWGNGGFAWIDYQTFGKYLIQGIVLVDNYSSYEKPFEWTGSITVQTPENTRELPVRLSDDGIYSPRLSLKTGTQIRFVLEGNNTSTAEGPVYPYVFYTDKAQGKTVQVWPPAGNAAPVVLEKGKPITIPAANQWIKTNDAVNANDFVFLFSRKGLDITAVRNSFEKQRGAVMDRLSAAVGKDKLIPAQYGLYGYSRINAIMDFLDMESVLGMVFTVKYDNDGKMPMDMVKISGGSFLMGSPKSDPYHNEGETQRTVKVDNFSIGETAVSVGEFREFVTSTKYKTAAEKAGESYTWSNLPYAQEDTYPVVYVNWIDAMEYCNWRSKQEGYKPVYTISSGNINIDGAANGYRLPTEAEWEYACRAGTNTPYNTGGNSITTTLANFDESYISKPASVKSYPPNKWGLYEMHGNVYEWTGDYIEGTNNVLVRGGAWYFPAFYLRSSAKVPIEMDCIDTVLGFRIARSDG